MLSSGRSAFSMSTMEVRSICARPDGSRAHVSAFAFARCAMQTEFSRDIIAVTNYMLHSKQQRALQQVPLRRIGYCWVARTV